MLVIFELKEAENLFLCVCQLSVFKAVDEKTVCYRNDNKGIPIKGYGMIRTVQCFPLQPVVQSMSRTTGGLTLRSRFPDA